MSDLIPDGWNEISIGDIGMVVTGFTPSTKQPEYWNGDIPFVSPADFNGQVYVNTTSRTLSQLGVGKARLLPSDSILVTCIGSLGGIAMTTKLSVTNQQINAVVPSSKEFSKYHFYNILFNIYQLEKNAGTTTLPIINKSSFEKIRVLRAPLPEQKKIAAILTSVDEVIEKTQAQIDKLKDLKKGMMQELLTKGVGIDGKPHTEFKDSPVGRIPKGWEVESFANVFTLKNGVNKGKEFFGRGTPIISYRNVFDGNGIYDNMLINKVEMTDSELSRFAVKRGDIFITRTSETPHEIGFTNVYLGVLTNVVFNGFVIRARQNKDYFDFEYCKYAFQAGYMREQMINNSKFTTRAGISGESLNTLKIVIPPINEQKKIGQLLSSIDHRIMALQNSKDAKSSLKKSLMQDLLTGKVRVEIEGK